MLLVELRCLQKEATARSKVEPVGRIANLGTDDAQLHKALPECLRVLMCVINCKTVYYAGSA